jgi:hypothetical protein
VSLTSLREKLIKIGAKVVSHGRSSSRSSRLIEICLARHTITERGVQRFCRRFRRRLTEASPLP